MGRSKKNEASGSRPTKPFDGTGAELNDGDWLIRRDGYVYALRGGWYLTSYMIEVERIKDRKQTLIDPSTTVGVAQNDLAVRPEWTRQTIEAIYIEVYTAQIRDRVRGEIAEHRREVQESWDRVQRGENSD